MTRNRIGKWAPRFLFAVLAVSLCRCGVGQQGSAATTMQLQHGGALTALAARVTLECAADQPAIFVGQKGVIRARGVSLTGSPLTYSFSASAGQLVAKGAVTELRTVGVGPQVVRVTCIAKDNVGNSASKVVEVTLKRVAILNGGSSTITPTTVIPHPVHVPTPITKVESATIPPLPKPAMPVQLPAPAPAPAPVQSVQEAAPPPPPPAPAPTTSTAPTTAAPAPATDGYQQGKTFDEWKKGLKTGKIEYNVPNRMLMEQSSTATVVIHGYGDTATTTLPNATGSGSLLQSERMKVELLAEDHPGDFTIVPQGDTIQFVPISGATTWTWSVTPNTPGEKHLMVRASVIYPGGDEKMAEQLQPYTAVVAVNVPSLWSNISESYRKDPLKWFSYVVPGGAGFTFLVGIFVWWRKKKGKE